MSTVHPTNSEESTAALGAGLAASLAPGAVLCLWGDLGLGKSVLARAIIRALAGDESLDVPSPTYTLLQHYETPAGPVFHFDLYRLTAPEEVYELGWDDALAEGITLIEWPQRLGTLLPARRTDILFAQGPNGPDSRLVEVRA